MMMFAVLWATLIAYLLFRAVRQMRAYRVVVSGEGKLPDPPPGVSVIVPARNEAANIGRCLRGVLRQGYGGNLETVVIDDGSTDGTGEIARREAEGQPECHVREAAPLPSGWTGKAHACWQGAQQTGGDWLLFLDADTVAEPSLVETAVAFAEAERIDMLSLEPEQDLGTFWERIILPGGMFMMAFFATDLRAINDPASPDAAANGQCILIRRSVYQAVRGHAAVASDISEDTALARRVKAAGFRTFLAGGRDLLRVRMYTRLSEIWEGLSKNAVNVVGGRRGVALAVALEGLLLGWGALLVPLAAVLAMLHGGSGPLPLLFALAGSLALLGTHISGARYFRIPWGYGLLFPLAYTMVAAIVVNSVHAYAAGAVRWKGRVYVPPGEEEQSVRDKRAAASGGDLS